MDFVNKIDIIISQFLSTVEDNVNAIFQHNLIRFFWQVFMKSEVT
jgi:hypothetical protein